MYHEITSEVRSRIDNIVENYDQAVMATLRDGLPFLSKVLPIVHDGEVYLLISDLSTHTENAKADSRVSIYFTENNEGLNVPRVTLNGELEKVEKKFELVQKVVARDKAARLYAQFDDFNMYKFIENDVLYVEGFGKAFK